MMHVKRYVANTFAEALIQAKNELGTEAMIVETKKLRVGGVMGLFSREVTELTVAVDQAANPRKPVKPVAAQVAPMVAATGPALGNLEREVASLRTAIGRLLEGSVRSGEQELDPPTRQLYEGLVARGVEENTALEIARRVRAGPSNGPAALRQEVSRLLGPGAPIVAKPGHHRLVALVGPTGVGKTTTLAKLAAKFTLEDGLKVGMITSDTYRIAAIEQLRTYADILGLPMYAVDTPAQVAEAMQRTADCDLVLVDTAGRSHKDAERMLELRELLAVLRPDETHLVLSLTSNPKDALAVLDAFMPVGVNRLTLTKLDEASYPGLILNLRMRCEQPLSYVTHGQSVPRDIVPADQFDFTKVLVGG